MTNAILEQPEPVRKPFFQDVNRLNLAFGFMTGVAILSTLGFFFVLARVGGTTTAKSSASPSVASVRETTPTPTQPSPEPSGPVQLAEIAKDDHIRGKFDAPVTLVEFSDIQCPFCRRFHPTMQQLLQEYPDKVRWVYKHFPLDSIHPQARTAALASECAAEQGKFWEFVDQAFESQELLGSDFYASTAKSLGLNEGKFKKCLDEQKYASLVEAQYQEGTKAGVNGTPTTFVNGQPVSGAQPYEAVKATVERALGSG